MNVEYKEFRPGRFVKVENGKVIGLVSKAEVDYYRILERTPNLDPALIEVSVGLVALMAFLASSDLPVPYRYIAALGFFLTSFSTWLLYSTYCIRHLPVMITEYISRERNGSRAHELLAVVNIIVLAFPIRFIRWIASENQSPQEMVELSLVALWWCIYIAWLAVLSYITGSFSSSNIWWL